MTQESTAQGNTTPYWVIAGVLVLAILAVAGWKLKQFLSPPSVATAVIEPDCNLHEGRCNASFADGTQVSLTISP
ncbi:MAG TPA: hypothetical protein DD979_01085, partial [Gammaproteobacteria bacterium]|nr:hypothetical protein [Gammaproteobacteria bacterium]